jgi:hypothetical protein
MPVYLKDISEFPELEKFDSVLIVPCRFCPAASLAVRRNKPYFEFFRRFLKTASYEQLIETIKSNLEKKGVKAPPICCLYVDFKASKKAIGTCKEI